MAKASSSALHLKTHVSFYHPFPYFHPALILYFRQEKILALSHSDINLLWENKETVNSAHVVLYSLF